MDSSYWSRGRSAIRPSADGSCRDVVADGRAGDDTIWPGQRDTIRSDCEVVKEYPYCEKGCRGSVKPRAGGDTLTLAKGSGKNYVRMRLGRPLKRLLKRHATIRAWTMGAHKGSPLQRRTPFVIRR